MFSVPGDEHAPLVQPSAIPRPQPVEAVTV